MPIALYALALCAFSIGTTELVVEGVLPDIVKSLDISLATGGALVTTYAGGVVIGAPLLTLLTRRIPRKALIIGVLLLYALGNSCSALAPSFTTLIIIRFLTGTMHGVFMAIGASIASSLVDESKRATAMAVFISGITVAVIVGVPLGTYIGQAIDWQATFVMLGVIALLGAAAVTVFVPSIPYEPNRQSLREVAALFSYKGLVSLYLVTITSYAALFGVYTFIVPTFTKVSGLGFGEVDGVLVLYGVTIAVGNLFGGRLADRIGHLRSLAILVLFLVGVLAVFGYTQHMAILSVGTMLLVGFLAYAITPILQSGVVSFARLHLPAFTDFASSINIASYNVGIMLGSLIASQTVRFWGLEGTPVTALVCAVLAIDVIGLAYRWHLAQQLAPAEAAASPPKAS